jgi:hypothetical protein
VHASAEAVQQAPARKCSKVITPSLRLSQHVGGYMLEKEIVTVISRVIELSGVIILVLGLLTATLRFIFRSTSESESGIGQ